MRDGEEVLARWTDCRYYPAKIESINKEGKITLLILQGRNITFLSVCNEKLIVIIIQLKLIWLSLVKSVTNDCSQMHKKKFAQMLFWEG